ncbi:MAG: phosphatase PAP2 family protein [Planifilum sp.]|jgi:undecaprenyl-diphosphatase
MNELALLDWMQSALRTPGLDQFMIAVTTIGDLGMVWLAMGCALLFSKRYRTLGIGILVAVALAGVVTECILKPMIMRPRPCDVNTSVALLVSHPYGSSFPSGHTCASFAAFGILLFAQAPRKLTVPAGILAILIAFSRLYLYVHYPSDVLAGAVIGLALGWLTVRMYRGFWNNKDRLQPEFSLKAPRKEGR